MQVSVSSRELSDLARDLRRAGRRDVTKEAGKRMRELVKPIVPEIRQAVRNNPGGTGDQRSRKAVLERPRGLRDATARGVQAKVSFSRGFAGVRLRVDTRHFPDGEKHLPQYEEGTRRPWRSKNWGRLEYKSQPFHPFFYPTIRPHIPRVQDGMREIADDMTDQLGGAL